MSGRNERIDCGLEALYCARDERELEPVIESLLTTCAEPVIRQVLRVCLRRTARLDSDAAEDLRNEVMLRLVGRMRRLHRGQGADTIDNFASYVAVVTYHTFDDAMRRAFPIRARLRNQIRYVLSHDRRFAIRTVEQGGVVGGLAGWRDRDPGVLPSVVDLPVAPHGTSVATILQRIFVAFPHPLALDALTDAAEQMMGLRPGPRPLHEADPQTVATHERPVAERLDDARLLEELWREIGELPLRQRVALLLNLRDPAGESVARFLPLLGIASIAEVGRAIGFSEEEIVRLWPDLPLDDHSIARLLGATRQQVINLRKSARARLTRRVGRNQR
jgi:hypothetical protein